MQQLLKLESASVEEIGKWLESVALGSLVPLFKEQDIDGFALTHLNEDDLKALGLTVGQKAKLRGYLNQNQEKPPSTAPTQNNNEPDPQSLPPHTQPDQSLPPTQPDHVAAEESTPRKKPSARKPHGQEKKGEPVKPKLKNPPPYHGDKPRPLPVVPEQQPSEGPPSDLPPPLEDGTPRKLQSVGAINPSTLKIISQGRLTQDPLEFGSFLSSEFIFDKTKYLLILCGMTFDTDFIKPFSGRTLQTPQTSVIFVDPTTITHLSQFANELSYLAFTCRLRALITSGGPHSKIKDNQRSTLVGFASTLITFIPNDFPIYVAVATGHAQPISSNFASLFTNSKRTPPIYGRPEIGDEDEEENEFYDRLGRFATFSTVVEIFSTAERCVDWGNEEGTVVYSFPTADAHLEWANESASTIPSFSRLREKYPGKTNLPTFRWQTIQSNSFFRILLWAYQDTKEQISEACRAVIEKVYRRNSCHNPVLINLRSYEVFDYDLFGYSRTRANIFQNVTRDFVRIAPLRWAPTISELSTTNWEGKVSILKIACYDLVSREKNSSTDPFVHVTNGPITFTSTALSKTRQPAWPGQGEQLNISFDELISTSKITFSVYDLTSSKFGGQTCEVAGKCSFNIRRLAPEFPSSQSFILEKSFILKPIKKKEDKTEKTIILHKSSAPTHRRASFSSFDDKSVTKHEKLKVKGFDAKVNGFMTVTMQFDKALKTNPPRYFGLSLKESIQNALDYKTVHPIMMCFEYLKSKASEEGIIREVGDKSKVKVMQRAMDAGAYDKLGGVTFSDHKEVVSLMKLFLSSLPDSLFTFALFGEIQDIAQLDSSGKTVRALTDKDINAFRVALANLPEPNLSIFSSLMDLLVMIDAAQKKLDQRQMTAGPLSIAIGITVFVPDHIKSSTTLSDFMELSGRAARTLQALIENWSHFAEKK